MKLRNQTGSHFATKGPAQHRRNQMHLSQSREGAKSAEELLCAAWRHCGFARKTFLKNKKWTDSSKKETKLILSRTKLCALRVFVFRKTPLKGTALFSVRSFAASAMILLASPLMLQAIPLEKAAEQTRIEVQKATEELNRLRDSIAAERQPLAEQLAELETEVRRLRQDAERLQKIRYQDELARETLARETRQSADAFSFIQTLRQEYRRAFEVRQNVAEANLLSEQLTALDQQLGQTDSASVIASTEALLKLAERWNLEKLGGTLRPGSCLDTEGVERKGTFAVFGPAAYFAATEHPEAAGLAINRIGSSRPSLFTEIAPEAGTAIRELVQGKDALVPVDLTEGDALKAAAQKESIKDHLLAGGFVIYPLLLLGGAAFILTIWKALSLQRIQAPQTAQIEQFAEQLKAGQINEAEASARAISAPFGTVLQAAVEHRDLRRDHLEEILHEIALGAIPMLERHLGLLAVLGAVAPLLGLLGTVTGMIHTFEMVTLFGTGDAKLLSGGISEALVTTETGLVIAVPVLLLHALLTRKVRNLIAKLEQTVITCTNRLHVQK